MESASPYSWWRYATLAPHARGAYFSIAPFFGALSALLLGEKITLPLVVAGALMAIGIWLHLTEHHEHSH